jgi:hypothetical protein
LNENELMICLVENKFKHVLYKDHINKYKELNKKIINKSKMQSKWRLN